MEAHDIYALYRKNKIIYKDALMNYYFDSKKYLENITKDIHICSHKPKNMKFIFISGINELESCINNHLGMEALKNIFYNNKTIDWKKKSIILNFISKILNCIDTLKPCLHYLKESTKIGFTFYGDINPCIQEVIKFLTSGNQMQTEDIDLTNVLNQLTLIIETFNQNINLINVFKASQYKFLNLLINITKCYNEFYAQNTNLSQTYRLKNILIDQNFDPILVYSAVDHNDATTNNLLISSLLACLTDYSDQIKRSLDSDTNNCFYKKTESLCNMLSNIDSKTMTELVTFLNEMITKLQLSNLSFEINDKIDLNANNIDGYIQILLNISKYHITYDSKTIREIIKKIFLFYDDDLDEEQINEILQMVSNFKDGEDFDSFIDEHMKNGEYYYCDSICQMIIKYLINPELLAQYKDLVLFDDWLEEDEFESNYLSFFDLFNYSNYTAYFKFVLDREFNFCIEKYYNQCMAKDAIEKERNILKENYSEFVINLVEDLKDNRIILPFYGFQTLDYVLYSQDQNMQLTFVDMIIMFLQVATALNTLHLNNEFHGYLSTSSIYVNSNKNVVIGEIAYDKRNEGDQTRIPEKVFYRAPEFLSYKDNPDDINSKKLSDIYSYGIIMYETITKIAPRKHMRNRARFLIYKIMNEGIRNSFFSEDNMSDVTKKMFDCFTVDIRGDNLIGMKEIIEKCLSRDPNDRYQSFDEIIQSIKNLPIYQKNKKEIDYRIEQAKDAPDNKSQLSDLLEVYYRGDKNSVKFIEKVFKDLNDLIYTDNLKPFVFNENDDIIQKVYNCFGIKFIHDL